MVLIFSLFANFDEICEIMYPRNILQGNILEKLIPAKKSRNGNSSLNEQFSLHDKKWNAIVKVVTNDQ